MDEFMDIQRAREEVEFKFNAWNMANEDFEPSAWLAYLSACERLNALLVEAKMQACTDGAGLPPSRDLTAAS